MKTRTKHILIDPQVKKNLKESEVPEAGIVILVIQLIKLKK